MKTAIEVQPAPMSMSVTPSASRRDRASRGRWHRARTAGARREMAAFDREPQILQRPGAHRHGMHRDAEPLAEHAARIGDAARLIDDIGRCGAPGWSRSRPRGSGACPAPAGRADACRRAARRPSARSARAFRLFGWPHWTEMMTFWMRRSASCSAASTALRIDWSASSRLVTAPERDALRTRAAPSPGCADRLGFGAADDAGDLGRADVERADQPGSACAHGRRRPSRHSFLYGTYPPCRSLYSYARRSRDTGRESPLCNRKRNYRDSEDRSFRYLVRELLSRRSAFSSSAS